MVQSNLDLMTERFMAFMVSSFNAAYSAPMRLAASLGMPVLTSSFSSAFRALRTFHPKVK
jgi:hypothetical protein